MVSASGSLCGSGGEQPGAWLHGDQAVGLRHVGERAARVGWHVQSHWPQERILPAVHSAFILGEGGRAR